MSTILKALRRLEADGPPEAREEDGGARSLPATDPRAADELRDRILAEEAAARIQTSADRARRRARPLVLGSLAACLVVAAGVGGFFMTRPGSLPDPALAAVATATGAAAQTGSVSAESQLARAASNTDGAVAAPTRRGVPIGVPIESLPMLSGKPAHPRPNAVPHDASDQPGRERDGVPNVAVAPTAAAAMVASAVSSESSVASESAQPFAAETRARSKKVETTPMPIAAVVPTRARAAADAGSFATRSGSAPARTDSASAGSSDPAAAPTSARERPSPEDAQNTREQIAVATPPRASKPIAVSSPGSKPVSKADTRAGAKPVSDAVVKLKARPAARKATDPKPVEQVAHQSLPDVTVVRTAWHPTPERRSARIHLNSTGKTLTLHEGDAVGGLIVHEISPSAVVFTSGDVEIRRRVGQP